MHFARAQAVRVLSIAGALGALAALPGAAHAQEVVDVFYWTGEDAGNNNWSSDTNWMRPVQAPGKGSDNDPGQDDLDDVALFDPTDPSGLAGFTVVASENDPCSLNASRQVSLLLARSAYTGLITLNNGQTLTTIGDRRSLGGDITVGVDISSCILLVLGNLQATDGATRRRIIVRGGGLDLGDADLLPQDPGAITASTIELLGGVDALDAESGTLNADILLPTGSTGRFLVQANANVTLNGTNPATALVQDDGTVLIQGFLDATGDTLTVNGGSFTLESTATLTASVLILAGGTVTLSGTFNGDFSMSGGNLVVPAGQTLVLNGNFSLTGGSLTLDGSLRVSGSFNAIGSATISGNGTVIFDGTGNQNFSPGGKTFPSLTVSKPLGTSVLPDGPLTVTGSLTVSEGTLHLSHPATFQGPVSVGGAASAAVLRIEQNAGFGANVDVLNQGTLTVPSAIPFVPTLAFGDGAGTDVVTIHPGGEARLERPGMTVNFNVDTLTVVENGGRLILTGALSSEILLRATAGGVPLPPTAQAAGTPGVRWFLRDRTVGASAGRLGDPDQTNPHFVRVRNCEALLDLGGSVIAPTAWFDLGGNLNFLNLPPDLAPIGNKTVAETATLSFTVSATDLEGASITYSALGLPAGATFGTTTGAFSWTPDPDDSVGSPYSITFTASDGTTSISEAIQVTVANPPPLLNPIGNKTTTEGSPLTFAVSAADPDLDVLVFSATGLPPGATLDAGTGAFSWTPDSNDSVNSPYPVTFTVTDAQGAFMSESISIAVTDNPDAVPPALTVSSPATDPFVTAVSPLAVSGTASDNVLVSSVTWINFASGESAAASGTSSWTASIPLRPGDNLIRLIAWDFAGNTFLDTITVTFTPADTTAPVIAITVPATDPFASGATPVVLGGTASDDTGVTAITWSNAATGTSGAVTVAGTWAASVPLTAGDNLITVTARDAVGNTAADSVLVTFSTPADTTAPSIQITFPTSAPDHPATSSPLLLQGTASDGTGVSRVTYTNAATGAGGVGSGTDPWSLSVALASGTNLITVTASDPAGNTQSDTLTVTFTASSSDAIAPLVEISSPTTGSTLQVTTDTVTLGGFAADDTAATAVVWANAATGDLGSASGIGSWSATIALAPGVNLITVTVYDEAGNASSDTLSVERTLPASGGGGGGGGGGCGLLGLELLGALLAALLIRRHGRNGVVRVPMRMTAAHANQHASAPPWPIGSGPAPIPRP